MSDAISGELLVPGEILGDWRSALRAIPHRTGEAFLRHPWLIETTGSRPLVTPERAAPHRAVGGGRGRPRRRPRDRLEWLFDGMQAVLDARRG